MKPEFNYSHHVIAWVSANPKKAVHTIEAVIPAASPASSSFSVVVIVSPHGNKPFELKRAFGF
jgi:hypothetical protein